MCRRCALRLKAIIDEGRPMSEWRCAAIHLSAFQQVDDDGREGGEDLLARCGARLPAPVAGRLVRTGLCDQAEIRALFAPDVQGLMDVRIAAVRIIVFGQGGDGFINHAW